jgi:hypothetical protein
VQARLGEGVLIDSGAAPVSDFYQDTTGLKLPADRVVVSDQVSAAGAATDIDQLGRARLVWFVTSHPTPTLPIVLRELDQRGVLVGEIRRVGAVAYLYRMR